MSWRGGGVTCLPVPLIPFSCPLLWPSLLHFLGLNSKLPRTSSQHQGYEQIASHVSLSAGVPCFPVTHEWHTEETVTFPTRGYGGGDVWCEQETWRQPKSTTLVFCKINFKRYLTLLINQGAIPFSYPCLFLPPDDVDSFSIKQKLKYLRYFCWTCIKIQLTVSTLLNKV